VIIDRLINPIRAQVLDRMKKDDRHEDLTRKAFGLRSRDDRHFSILKVAAPIKELDFSADNDEIKD
jgi:hypothetical protein